MSKKKKQEVVTNRNYKPGQQRFTEALDPLREFRVVKESISLHNPAESAVRFVQQDTELAGREYSIVLLGRRLEKQTVMELYCFHRAKAHTTAHYTPNQNKCSLEHLCRNETEVVFGHSHVAKGEEYNKFSPAELHNLIARAKSMNRDVYGMLVTKDRIQYIKYDLRQKEFFLIRS